MVDTVAATVVAVANFKLLLLLLLVLFFLFFEFVFWCCFEVSNAAAVDVVAAATAVL